MYYDPDWEEVSLREWAMRYATACQDRDPSLVARVERFFDTYGEALDALLAHQRLQRLKGRRQFGERRYQVRATGGTLMSRAYPHTRFVHVTHVASLALVMGLVAQLEPVQLHALVCGALLHDLEHPAFSHTGDRWLVEVLGWLDHEERACQVILTDVSLHVLLARLDTHPEAVAAVVREQGVAGRLQSLADTAGYAQLDGRILGLFVPGDYSLGARLVRSLLGVTSRGFIISDTEPVQDVLDTRLKLMELNYRSVGGRITDALMGLLISGGLHDGWLDPEDLRTASCDVVERQVYSSLTRQSPGWMHAAADVIRYGWHAGGPWEHWYGQDTAEAERRVAASRYTAVSWGYDHAQKTYTCAHEGQVQDLRARDAQSQSGGIHHVITYTGA